MAKLDFEMRRAILLRRRAALSFIWRGLLQILVPTALFVFLSLFMPSSAILDETGKLAPRVDLATMILLWAVSLTCVARTLIAMVRLFTLHGQIVFFGRTRPRSLFLRAANSCDGVIGRVTALFFGGWASATATLLCIAILLRLL